MRCVFADSAENHDELHTHCHLRKNLRAISCTHKQASLLVTKYYETAYIKKGGALNETEYDQSRKKEHQQ